MTKIKVRVTNLQDKVFDIQFEPNGILKHLKCREETYFEIEKIKDGLPLDILIDNNTIIINENNDVYIDDVVK